MTTAKRLICGHLFHVHCLRSWLERQHTCPICRALVIPNEHDQELAGVQHQSQNFHILLNNGANSANTSSQDQTGEGEVKVQEVGMSAGIRRESKLQLLLYIRNLLFTLLQHGHLDVLYFPTKSNIDNAASSGEHGNSIPNNSANFSAFTHQFMLWAGVSPNHEDGWSTNLQMSVSQLEAQKKIIQHQIEVLQNQLQRLRKPASEKSSVTESSSNKEAGLTMTTSDSKGKAVSSSSLSGVGGDEHQNGMGDKQDEASFAPL